jgi:glycosyltransferase involved in cell wall biosynthesis
MTLLGPVLRSGKDVKRVAMIVWNEFTNDARVLKEAETLQSAGFSVTVYALHVSGKTPLSERIGPGIHVIRTPAGLLPFVRRKAARDVKKGAPAPQWQPTAIVQLLRMMAHSLGHVRILWKIVLARPDVVHAHDVNTLPTGWAAAALSGARLVYDAHEISTGRVGYSSIRTFVAWIERAIMPVTWANITTTNARAKFFARAYGIERPVVLQNRPRLAVTERSERIRRELSLTEEWPIVLYQGMIQEGRGLERLVEVVARIPNIYLVLIGGGRLEQFLKHRIVELGVENTVRILPTVPLAELPEYTASADIGVQPIENTCLNHFTTDSNKLFEYMMAGLPVVASNLPEIRGVVSKGGWGVLVPPGDSAALAEALTGLAMDRNARERMGAAARMLAIDYNWEQQENLLLSIYQSEHSAA